MQDEIMLAEQIILKRKEPPRPASVDEDFQWICHSLGICGLRSGDESSDNQGIRLFRFIVAEAASKKQGVTIRQISENLELSRTATVHHLTRITRAGLVIKKGREYHLRRYNLELTINEVRHDFDRMIRELQGIARELDADFGFEKRRTD